MNHEGWDAGAILITPPFVIASTSPEPPSQIPSPKSHPPNPTPLAHTQISSSLTSSPDHPNTTSEQIPPPDPTPGSHPNSAPQSPPRRGVTIHGMSRASLARAKATLLQAAELNLIHHAAKARRRPASAATCTANKCTYAPHITPRTHTHTHTHTILTGRDTLQVTPLLK